MTTLTLQNLALAFDNPVFSDVSFALPQGQIACLLGKSGCGKTSILRCLLGFETPKAGQITLGDTVLFDAQNPQKALAPHLRQIGMVFQDYALFSHLTVRQNIGFGIKKLENPAQIARIDELLTLIEMQDLGDRYPHELSGGQQQRVALARALAPKPSLILLDEPFSNLDVALRQELSYQVRTLLKASGVSAILVTHDQSEAFAFADVVGVMIDGTLAQWANPSELYHKPANQAVARFIGDGSLLPIYASDNGQVLTALGGVPCHNALPAHSPAVPNTASATFKVLVRPQHINTAKHERPNWATAVVKSKAFLGATWQYAVKLLDDSELLVHTPNAFEVGDTMYLQATQGWLVAQ